MFLALIAIAFVLALITVIGAAVVLVVERASGAVADRIDQHHHDRR